MQENKNPTNQPMRTIYKLNNLGIKCAKTAVKVIFLIEKGKIILAVAADSGQHAANSKKNSQRQK